MLRLAGKLVLLCALLTSAAVAQAKEEGHDRDRAAITAAYAAMDKAASNKDTDGWIKYHAASFLLVRQYTDAQTENKAQQRQGAAGFNRQASDITAHTTVKDIRFRRARAIVTTGFYTTFTSAVGPHPTRIQTNLASRDVWKKFGREWREVKTDIFDAHTTIDGKPVKQPDYHRAPKFVPPPPAPRRHAPHHLPTP